MPDYVDVDPTIISLVSNQCLALPEAWTEPAWTGHRFLVRKNNFAHVFALQRPDGAVQAMLQFRSPDGEREFLIASGHPFFKAGWGEDVMGMVLDDSTDWEEVGELVTESYCLMAPKKLIALLDLPDPDDSNLDSGQATNIHN